MLPYMIMLEGFDDAFEGFVVQEKLQRPTVAVYNRKKCIKIIMKEKKLMITSKGKKIMNFTGVVKKI